MTALKPPTDAQRRLLLAAVADSKHALPGGVRGRTLDRMVSAHWIEEVTPDEREASAVQADGYTGFTRFVITTEGREALMPEPKAAALQEANPHTGSMGNVHYAATCGLVRDGLAEFRKTDGTVIDSAPMVDRFRLGSLYITALGRRLAGLQGERPVPEYVRRDGLAVHTPGDGQGPETVLIEGGPDRNGQIAVLRVSDREYRRVPFTELGPFPGSQSPPAGDLTDWWSITDLHRTELARVQGPTRDAALIAALRIPHVSAIGALPRLSAFPLHAHELTGSEPNTPVDYKLLDSIGTVSASAYIVRVESQGRETQWVSAQSGALVRARLINARQCGGAIAVEESGDATKVVFTSHAGRFDQATYTAVPTTGETQSECAVCGQWQAEHETPVAACRNFSTGPIAFTADNPGCASCKQPKTQHGGRSRGAFFTLACSDFQQP
ncbi:hypothetical protein [Streptomyces albipurpureus]|uniref:Uncharacterized protein n=1 Tax=Streptomyces albipurpureus TaxID=2897419 RepID=A0ABT0UJK7_9ACTN|nr:hypothetical protein [Streptomyces sp. CWNU-1]MCM2388812.1 hypothetical protein [Streptomyces sp. CWNU-1]